MRIRDFHKRRRYKGNKRPFRTLKQSTINKDEKWREGIKTPVLTLDVVYGRPILCSVAWLAASSQRLRKEFE